MPRTSLAIRSFNGGELSPRLGGRADLGSSGGAYLASANVLENFLPLVQGPLMHRGGTRYVRTVKDSADTTVLIPFTVSNLAAYVIEAGDLYFRFYTAENRLETAGPVVVELVTTYATADLRGLQWAQSADTLYIVHPDYPPRKLVRTSATTFAITTVDFLDGPYLDENTDTGDTLNASAGTGAITITAVGHTPFLAGRDEGRHVRIRNGVNFGWAQITSVTSTTVVNATVRSAAAMPTGAFSTWRLGAWYGGSYPRTVTFHEQRLCFAGAPDTIQRIDMSMTGDYERFSPTGLQDETTPFSGDDVNDDNAISYTIGSNELNAILWLRVQDRLLAGTAQSLFSVAASTQGEAITPTNINVSEEDMTGAAEVQPARLGNSILFVGRSGRTIQSAGISIEEDGGVATTDLTELADHIADTDIAQIQVARDPIPMLWVITESGRLACMTYRPSHKVYAWSRMPIGGDGLVRSIAVIPYGAQDQLWLIVEREIDGNTVQYVEFMEEPFRLLDPAQALEDAFFVDSGITYDGAATDTFTGADHLEGATCAVLADGAVRPDVTIASGGFTLASEASVVHVGFQRDAVYQSLVLETPDPEGASMGKSRAFDKVTVKLLESLGGKIGRTETTAKPLLYRTAEDPMNEPPPLFSGDHPPITFPDGWTTEPRITFVQDKPLPMTLLALGLLGATGTR